MGGLKGLGGGASIKIDNLGGRGMFLWKIWNCCERHFGALYTMIITCIHAWLCAMCHTAPSLSKVGGQLPPFSYPYDKPEDAKRWTLIKESLCFQYGSTLQLVGGVVTSHLVDLELIHTAEACTPADHML